MAGITDPARELSDLCQRLRSLRPNVPGAQVLADEFQVPVWSAEFYELIFTIAKRINGLKTITQNLDDVDEDLRAQAAGHLDTMLRAFSPEGLNNAWAHAMGNFLTPAQIGPIRFLSLEVRHKHAFPQLTEDEQAELLADVDELLSWLRDFQIKDQDFIRQALIDGLESFRFRMARMSWLGWAYTLESLREVIGAYLALERGLDPNEAPDSQAVLQKVGAVLKVAFEKIGVAKDFSEKANWLIEGYKNVSALALAHQGIVGLIAHVAS